MSKRQSTTPHPNSSKKIKGYKNSKKELGSVQKKKYYKNFKEWLEAQPNIKAEYIDRFEEPNDKCFATCSCQASNQLYSDIHALKDHVSRSKTHKKQSSSQLTLTISEYALAQSKEKPVKEVAGTCDAEDSKRIDHKE